MEIKRYIKPLRFLIIGLVLYVGWVFLHEGLLKPERIIDPWLTNIVSEHSVGILNLMGYEIEQFKMPEYGNRIISGTGTGLLRIAHLCNGLELYVIFAIFLLAFPGSWKNKVWFIPVGFVIIYLVNLIRVISLILIQMYHPDYLQFNHKYTFVIIVYGVIFGLWVVWVKFFGRPVTDRRRKAEA